MTGRDAFSEAADPAAMASAFDLAPRYIERAGALDALIAAFARARDRRELKFVVLVGEPGMGKTRTVRELGRRVREEAPTARFVIGEADGGRVAYGAFARLLASRFGIGPGAADDEAQERIRAAVAEVLPAPRVTEAAHLLAHMLRVPFADSPVVNPLAESPQQLEARTFIALRRFLAADADRTPLVLCCENLELCGPETVNLIHYLAAGLAGRPILIVGTARERLYDRYPSFGEGDVRLEQIYLGALSPDESETMLRELCRPLDAIPDRILQHARSLAGSPRSLFELVRLLCESGVIVHRERGWTVDAARLQDEELPDSYDDIVARRLEVIRPEERAVLEKAAVVGNSFWLDCLVALDRVGAISPDEPDGPTLGEIAAARDEGRTRLADLLARLVEREWIVEHDSPEMRGEREFRFAYPTLRAAVYAGTRDPARSLYHKLAAQWLELRPEGRAEALQESIGRHLELAGDVQAATARYRRAADAARAAFFNDKAIRLYSHALVSLGHADLAARIHLWHDLGSVYELKGDFDAALGAFERMLRLAWVCASRTKAAVAYNKMGRVWRRKGDLKLALQYLERGRSMFEHSGDTRGIAGSLDDVGTVLYLLGRLGEAYEKVTEGLARRGARGDRRSIAQSLSNLGNIQKDRGRLADALRCHDEALSIRRQIGDRAGVITSLNNLAVLALERGDVAEARGGWEDALSEAEHIGALPLQALALCNLGELALIEEHHEEARSRLEDALDIAEDIEDRQLVVAANRNLALLEHASGDSATARELAHHAHEVAAKSGLREAEGRALVTLGEVFAATAFDADRTVVEPADGETPPAEDYFARGVALLRQLGNDSELAKGLELFGRHKLESGQVAPARALLEEALELYARLEMRQVARVEKLLAGITPSYA